MIDIGAVIPARLTSSRINQKPLQKINGVSLLDRKILQLKEVFDSKQIIVSTESDILKDIALSHNVNIHERDPIYSIGHNVTFSQLIKYVVQNINHEHIWWVPPVVPFFNALEFRASLENYTANVVNGNYDSLLSVVEKKDYMWDSSGPLNYFANKNHSVSQDLPTWFMVTNGLYGSTKAKMLEWEYLIGGKVFLDKKPKSCSIDIDIYEDLKLAQATASYYDK